METLPNLKDLSDAEKDALILRLWQELQALKAKLGNSAKTSANSSVPPSLDQKPDLPVKPRRVGPRRGSLGREGGGRPLAENPDQTIILKACHCAHCQVPLADEDQSLSSQYDKIDIPPVKPIITRVERYTGHCSHCGGNTPAPTPEGL